MNTTLLRLHGFVAALLVLAAGCARQSDVATSPAVPGEAARSALAQPVASAPAPAALPERSAPERRLPRLVDIGAGTCIPCRMMAPILAELKHTRAHQFETIFVDLNHEPEKAMSFRIRVIPTQVFYDDDNRELFRHEGFMSKEQILEAWSRLGHRFDRPN